jgi:DNA-binding protein YbaB
MRAEFLASLEGLVEDYDRHVGRLQDMQDKLEKATATARSEDGLVRVEVDARAQVTDLHLDPKVYDKLTPDQLSRTILRLIGEATEDVAAQMKALMAPFMPANGMFGGQPDLGSFLPQARGAVDDDK